MWSFLYFAVALQLAGVLALAVANSAYPHRRRGVRLLAAAPPVASTVTLVTGAVLTIASGQYQAGDVTLITLMAIFCTVVNVLILGLFGFWAELRRALDNRRRSSGPPDIESIP
ncbi:hypothetical protein P9A14_12620 [Gordonia hongkongensis]|uniref:Uncharacterized protein n=2 Tax=Gordonia TaxID=2053 RepID=A0AAW4GB31_GORRU|nr:MULTISPECIES: hypothetical protein [Gordonia]OCW85679.1 hypothetical protein A8M60_04195 [Nocardia farcinica]PZT84796.1 MAG: hypothetical protein DI630_36670 [Gordonia sp. (in: high G+C Gram-positive bacteria)]QIK47904.1 hypothetical protein G8C36_12140 [Gordonia terrae]MBM7280533.1 hypothetical protein [Gordonia rubripertincta]MBN0973790.1 hypothetical protein [Gordonia sp. BP-119]